MEFHNTQVFTQNFHYVENIMASSGTQALERGLLLLDCIAGSSERGLRLSELAEMTGLNLTTTHRLLKALERLELVQPSLNGKGYRLGLKVFQYASRHVADGSLVAAARPALLRLVAATGDSAFLMVRSGFNAVCMDRQDGDYTINTLTGRVGGSTPLGLGIGSVTVLAGLPAEERSVILDHNRTKYSDQADRFPSVELLDAIVAKGYHYDRNAILRGVVGIGVPLKDQYGVSFAAICSGTIEPHMTDEHFSMSLELLKREAALIEVKFNSNMVD